jgi:hypothetical protein
MRTNLSVAAVAVLLVLSVGCGDDSEQPPAGSTTASTATTVEVTSTTEASTTTSVIPTTLPATTAPSTTAIPAVQPAMWPAPDVVFATPEDAARDFVAKALGVPPVLGEFQQGDSRSGEIVVFLTDGETPIDSPRGTLLLRQLGASDGWFVIAAVSDGAGIDVPASGSTIAAGPLQVSGKARGFEASINVVAFVAGRADPLLDQQVTQAGNFDELLPYEVTLNVEGAAPGDTVVVLVRGGVGLETDPGEFAAIPVVVG